ncbi:chromate transporter [Bacillus massiliigorillae]|uniref:chromate transporter n=1 Tax=Bacillus massiliigorillae TaxID=1243664 RepID=UPI00039CF711|nr:chromate transporter [Bacillus massiliigorillae]
MYKDLTIGMVRTGILGFGGGPSVIPLIRYEAVTRYHWLEDDEFGDILAIANTLPGPIATKMAAYLGYRVKGWKGAIVSVAAHVLPTCLAMVFLVAFINQLSTSTTVQHMIGAVMPVVAVMLGQMAYEFGEKAVKGLGWILGFLLFLISFIMLQIISLHPGIVIAIFLLYGAFHFKWKQRWAKKKGDNEGETI